MRPRPEFLSLPALVALVFALIVCFSALMWCLPGPAGRVDAAEEPGEYCITLLDTLKAMGVAGVIMLALFAGALVLIPVNLFHLRKVSRFIPHADAGPADVSAATERFLILPGALLGIGLLEVTMGPLGTAVGLSRAFGVLAVSSVGASPRDVNEGLHMALASSALGLSLGAVCFAFGLAFRGIIQMRRAKIMTRFARA